MIVVTGATGRTGGAAARALLEKGETIRVVGRDSNKLQPLVQKGAEAFVGNIEDPAFLQRAFDGAHAVYLVVPEDIAQEDFRAHQERVSDYFSKAVSRAQVSHVVALSSIGAQHAQGTGPIVGLHNLEQKLNSILGLNVLFLRAGYFMENLMQTLAPLHAMGALSGGLSGDYSTPWIATRDIGAYAAGRLLARDFSASSIQELHGQRDISMNEAASVVGREIGKPNLQYVQLPIAMLEPALIQMGLRKNTVASLIEMWNGANSGLIVPQERRSAKNSTATTLESFVAEVFAPAYAASVGNH